MCRSCFEGPRGSFGMHNASPRVLWSEGVSLMMGRALLPVVALRSQVCGRIC